MTRCEAASSYAAAVAQVFLLGCASSDRVWGRSGMDAVEFTRCSLGWWWSFDVMGLREGPRVGTT